MRLHTRLARSWSNTSAAILLAVASISGFASPASAVPLEPNPQGCTQTIESPHPSKGQGSAIIAKARFICFANAGSFTWKEWIGTIYRCSSEPVRSQGEAGWTRNSGCQPVASNSSTSDGGAITLQSLPKQQEITRYIPKTGGTTNVPNVWFIACLRGYLGNNTPFAVAGFPRKNV